MTRRRLPPDNRPDWRDPDMPILLEGNVYTPDEATRMFQERVRLMTETLDRNPQFYWRNDPLYHGKKKP
jgi:hypothetical protein